MIKPEILYEDNHIIVVIKPAGILSQGDYSDEPSILDEVREYIRINENKPGAAFTGLIHRLDRPVSGVMVFAKTSKAARRLHSEITDNGFQKFYTAVIDGYFENNIEWRRLENYLVRDRDFTYISNNLKSGAKKGELFFRNISSRDSKSLIIIKLITGRKHQIRAQFSNLGMPVTGDKKYGSRSVVKEGICLHSSILSFKHPVKSEVMTFYAPLPDRFRKFIPDESGSIDKIIIDSALDFNYQAFASK